QSVTGFVAVAVTTGAADAPTTPSAASTTTTTATSQMDRRRAMPPPLLVPLNGELSEFVTRAANHVADNNGSPVVGRAGRHVAWKTAVFPKWLVVAGFVVAALGFFGESTLPLLDRGIGLFRLGVWNVFG